MGLWELVWWVVILGQVLQGWAEFIVNKRWREFRRPTASSTPAAPVR